MLGTRVIAASQSQCADLQKPWLARAVSKSPYPSLKPIDTAGLPARELGHGCGRHWPWNMALCRALRPVPSASAQFRDWIHAHDCCSSGVHANMHMTEASRRVKQSRSMLSCCSGRANEFNRKLGNARHGTKVAFNLKLFSQSQLLVPHEADDQEDRIQPRWGSIS